MSGPIILGRANQALKTCSVCRKPSPADQVSRRSLCHACWQLAAAEEKWVAEPMIAVSFADGSGMAYPVRLMLPAMLQPLVGERGNDQNPARALARVLEERRILAAEVSEHGVADRCCYCGEAVSLSEDAEEMVAWDDTDDGLPPIWHCKNFRTCDSRLAQQIGVLVQRMANNQHGN